MVKVTRYFICSLFLMLGGLLNALSVSIDLSQLETIPDGKGNVIRTAYLGENFTIMVKVDKGDRNTGDVTVDGLDVLNILGRNQQTSVSVINGSYASHITYTYTALADKEGIFNVGPAYVFNNGQKIQSDVVTFQVIKSTPERQARQVQADKAAGIETPKVFVELQTSTERCVVGEQVEAIIHIAYAGPVVDLSISSLPQFKGFLSRKVEQLRKGQEEIDGVLYTFVEQKYVLSPLQTGEKSLGSAQIVYSYRQQNQKRRRAGGFFGEDLFNDLFDMNMLRKATVASNSVTLQVDPLPPFRGKVDGIGHSMSLSALFDKREVTQNEPVVLKILLTGHANFDQITELAPQVPEGVKWYKSKAETKLQSEFGGTKEFEYIVQVPQAGFIEFPPQTFTFFDTQDRTYKTVKSRSFELLVTPAPEGMGAPSIKQDVKPETPIQEKVSEKLPEKKSDIHFIQEDSSVHHKKAPSLPVWLFLIIIFIPLLFWQRSLFVLILDMSIFKRRAHQKSLAKYDDDLAKLVERGDAAPLYHFFIHYFATKAKIPVSDVTENFITIQLRDLGLEAEKIDEFLAYLNECASIYFTSAQVSSELQSRLVKRAKYWYLLINK